MLYSNDPFERAGADALDLESQVAHAVTRDETDELEDLDWLLEDEPVDTTLDRVSGIEFGYNL